MKLFRKNIKLQVQLGSLGIFTALLLWRVCAPFVSGKLDAWPTELLNCIAYMSVAFIPSVIMIHAKDHITDLGFSVSRIGRQILTGIFLGLAMGCLLTFLPMALGLKSLVFRGAAYTTVSEAVYRLAYFCLIVGLTEEFVFRGFLYENESDLHFLRAVWPRSFQGNQFRSDSYGCCAGCLFLPV